VFWCVREERARLLPRAWSVERSLQFCVEDDGQLNAAVDDADLVAGNLYDLGRDVLEETAQNDHVAA